MEDILSLVKRDPRNGIPQGRAGLDVSIENLFIQFQIGLIPILCHRRKVGERCGIGIFSNSSTFGVSIERRL